MYRHVQGIHQNLQPVQETDVHTLGENIWGSASFSAGAGCAVTDSVLRQSFRCEIAVDTGHFTLVSIWNIFKAYDYIKHNILADKSVLNDFPLTLLCLDLAAYAWPRRLSLDKAVGRTIKPTRSIVAGITGATYEIRCYMIDQVRTHANLFPMTFVNIHIDDIVQDDTDHSEDDLIERFSETAFHLVNILEADLDFFSLRTSVVLCPRMILPLLRLAALYAALQVVTRTLWALLLPKATTACAILVLIGLRTGR